MYLVFSALADVKNEDKFEFPLTDLFHSEAGRFPAKHCEDRLTGDFIPDPTQCLFVNANLWLFIICGLNDIFNRRPEVGKVLRSAEQKASQPQERHKALTEYLLNYLSSHATYSATLWSWENVTEELVRHWIIHPSSLANVFTFSPLGILVVLWS